MSGAIASFFHEDHRRLDALLQRTLASPTGIDLAAFASFRAGLLRHIALEEKLLVPALRRALGDDRVPFARRLRVDHGAIALLLVPSPTPALIAEIRSILEPHNRLEEGPEGLYSLCDELPDREAEGILAAAASYPEVKVAPHHNSERACRTAAEALHISGKQR